MSSSHSVPLTASEQSWEHVAEAPLSGAFCHRSLIYFLPPAAFCEKLRLDIISGPSVFFTCREDTNSFKKSLLNKHYVPDTALDAIDTWGETRAREKRHVGSVVSAFTAVWIQPGAGGENGQRHTWPAPPCHGPDIRVQERSWTRPPGWSKVCEDGVDHNEPANDGMGSVWELGGIRSLVVNWFTFQMTDYVQGHIKEAVKMGLL